MNSSTIHTTIHLSLSNAIFLEESAARLGLSRSKLVVLLMRKLVEHWKSMKRNYVSVKYQKNVNCEGWKVVHVFLSDEDYEMCIDMRKFFKWSVSALVAMAMKKYLDELVAGGKRCLKEHDDNYKLLGYECEGKLDKNNICWHIVWKLSEKYAQKLSR